MSPEISSNCPGLFLKTPFSLSKAGYNIFFTSVVFPLPETPVTAIKLLRGKSTEIFFKLFSLAPLIDIFPPEYLILSRGSIASVLFKYIEVRLFDLRMSLIEP